MLRLKIREIAEEKGYNMSSLSRAADISFTTIKRLWKNPYIGANTKTLEQIAATLGVSVMDLVEEVREDEEEK